MGCFSKCCAKTHLPVLMHDVWAKDALRLTRIVVLLRGHKPYPGEYDGYGMGLDDDFDDAKFVLEDAYKGERWEDLPESGYEPGQGIFHDTQFVRAIATLPNGFATYDDYWNALRDYENETMDIMALVFSKLEIPPPETLYVNMSEYLHYLVQGMAETANDYADRHPEVLDWLPDDAEGRLVQAQLYTQAMNFETAAAAEKILAPYKTPVIA